MTYASKSRENRIAISLAKCASSIKQTGGGQWSFEVANGKTLSVSARILQDWLLLDAPLTDRVGRSGWWELLRLNAAISGIGKFVLTPDARSVHLRADLPLRGDDESEGEAGGDLDDALTTRLLETCAGLKAAFRTWRGEKTAEPPALTPTNNDSQGDRGIEELRRLCGIAGWPFIERSSGALMVDLDVRGDFYQAAVERDAQGAQVSVEIAQSAAPSETDRQALSRLLLGTGAMVKLARPAITEANGEIAARFEVRFTTMPTAFELSSAFASLSVACAMSGREARAIQDEGIARVYLTMHGDLGAQTSLPASSGRGDQKGGVQAGMPAHPAQPAS